MYFFTERFPGVGAQVLDQRDLGQLCFETGVGTSQRSGLHQPNDCLVSLILLKLLQNLFSHR